MSWIDILQLTAIVILGLLFLTTRVPACPHNVEDLQCSHDRVAKLWTERYQYKVVGTGNYYIKRTHPLESGSYRSPAYRTKEEAEAWMKTPQGVVFQRNEVWYS